MEDMICGRYVKTALSKTIIYLKSPSQRHQVVDKSGVYPGLRLSPTFLKHPAVFSVAGVFVDLPA